jgi:hypothetical protein
MPGSIGSTGWDRSSAWTWDCSSTPSTSARSGGSSDSPTTSRTLSMHCGSPDSLNPRSGGACAEPPSRSARPWISTARPLGHRRSRPGVALFGSPRGWRPPPPRLFSSLIVRGAPGRGASTSPSNRRATHRARHLPTVGSDPPRWAASCLLVAPVAQASTIRHRNANAWELLAPRDQRTSVSSSSSVKINRTFGRPVLGMPNTITSSTNFRRRTLGCDRLDRPPVTHRLDGEAASAATGDLQDASSPDPKALHRDLREVTGPGQLEVAPAVLRKALAVE